MPKKTFEAASAADAHLIVQLKDNQPTLCLKVEVACAAAAPLSSVKTVDKNRRNRHETRTIKVFDAKLAVAGTEWQPLVAAVIQVERSLAAYNPATGSWKPSLETSFYLSNRPVDAETAADAIRKHWGIENNPTTRATSLCAKTPRAFEPTPESSPDSAASPTISCVTINPTPSLKTALPPLSAASNQSSQ